MQIDKMRIKNGFIYPFLDGTVNLLKHCNLVELFKFVAKYYAHLSSKNGAPAKPEELISASNIAIDTYQLFKFLMLWLLWSASSNGFFSEVAAYYLIFTNIFTYFYYHTWGSKFQQRQDRDAQNRRFANLIIAIIFYLLCYAYLYQGPYRDLINWPGNQVNFDSSIYLSVATAFTLSSEGFSAKLPTIKLVFMGQHLLAFLFFAIILAGSIPNHTQKEQE